MGPRVIADKINIMKFKVLTVMKIMLFWVAMQCGLTGTSIVSDIHTLSAFRAEGS
jgi:hypothetical protein